MVHNKRGGVNPLRAMVAGAVVGAGAVIAGAVVLSDKNNQKKANEALLNVKNRVEDYLGKVQKGTKKVTKKAKQEVKKI